MRPRLRSWVRTLLWAAGIAVVLRLMLAATMPWIVDRVAATRGLACEYESLRLSLLAGDLELRGLALRERDSTSEPLAEIDLATIDVAAWRLLRGDVRVERAVIDGARVRIERLADGRVPWLERLATTDEPEPDLAAESDGEELDLGPPIEVVALRIHQLELVLRDQDAAPPLDAMLVVDARLSDLVRGRRAQLSMFATGPRLVDSIRVRGELASDRRELAGELDLAVDGLRAKPAARTLEQLGIRPTADVVDFGAKLRVRASAGSNPPNACAAQLELAGVDVRADGASAFSLARLSIEAPSASRRRADGVRVVLEGLDAAVTRTATGVLAWAGFELIEARADDATARPTQTAVAPATKPFELAFTGFQLERTTLRARDLGVEPPVDHAIAIRSIDVGAFALDVADAQTRTPFAVRASIDGACGSFAVDGELAIARDRAELSAALDARAIDLARLAPYCATAGIEPTMREGSARAKLAAAAAFANGRVELSASVAELEIADRAVLARCDRAAVERATIDLEQRSARIESISSRGVQLAIERGADGAWNALGLRARGPAQAPAQATNPRSPQPDGDATPWTVTLETLEIADHAIAWVDATSTPPLALQLGPLSIQAARLSFNDAATRQGTLQARFAAPEIVDEIVLDATLDSSADGASLRGKLRARNVRAGPLERYLAAVGLESTVAHGELAVDVAASIESAAAGPRLDLALEQASWRDGERAWATLDALRVGGVELAPAIRVAAITVERPTLELERRRDGKLGALGLWIDPAAATPPRTDDGRAEAATAQAASPIGSTPLALGALSVVDAVVRWHDARIEPAIDSALRARVSVRDLALATRLAADRAAATRAVVEVDAAIEGALETAALRASVELASNGARVDGAFELDGLRAGPFAAYLPASIRSELRAARLSSSFAADVAVADDGAIAAALDVTELAFSDADQPPFATLGRLHADVERRGESLRIATFEIDGASLRAERSTATEVRAMGFAIGAASPPPAELPTASSAPTRARATDLAIDRAAMRDVRVELLDRSHGDGATPLRAIIGLELARIEPVGEQPGGHSLTLTSSLEPLAEALEVRATFTARPDEPELRASLRIDGLRPGKLVELAPSLASRLAADPTFDGELRAELTARPKLARKPRGGFDLAKPFAMELAVERIELVDRAGGVRVAGLESLRAEIARIDPASGDVAIANVELGTPSARVTRDAQGVRAFGLIVPIAPAATRPVDDGAERAERAAEGEIAPVAVADDVAVLAHDAAGLAHDAAVLAHDAAVLSIDRLAIAGLDVEIRDETVDPIVVVPLTGLDVEVRKFTTLALREPRPIHFNAFLRSGDVALPKRVQSDSVLTGVASAVGSALAGGGDEALELEQRPLFDEVAIAGRLTLAPRLEGWVTANVAALELMSVAHVAREAGVTIGDGMLDSSLRLRFQGERGIAVEASPAFSYLSLSEAAGGPVSAYLRLPAPLDTVLFLLKDAQGEHKVPVSFRLTDRGVSAGDVASAAAGAAAGVIARAVASAPLRLVGTVTGLFGLGGDDEPKPKLQSSLTYAPATTSAHDPDEQRALASLAERVADDESLVVAVEHAFGELDFERAVRLANPSLEDCGALAKQLRRKKAALERERADLAARTRVQVAVARSKQTDQALERLRALDRELGFNEDALDRLHELLRPGAERRRDQRTRAALLAIASHRVERVRASLIESGVDAERIEPRQIRVVAGAAGRPGEVRVVVHERR